MVKQANKRRLERLRAGKPDKSWNHIVFFTSADDPAAAAKLARLRAAAVPENEITVVKWLDSYDPDEDRAIWEAARQAD